MEIGAKGVRSLGARFGSDRSDGQGNETATQASSGRGAGTLVTVSSKD
jgi:hypothetical protein